MAVLATAALPARAQAQASLKFRNITVHKDGETDAFVTPGAIGSLTIPAERLRPGRNELILRLKVENDRDAGIASKIYRNAAAGGLPDLKIVDARRARPGTYAFKVKSVGRAVSAPYRVNYLLSPSERKGYTFATPDPAPGLPPGQARDPDQPSSRSGKTTTARPRASASNPSADSSEPGTGMHLDINNAWHHDVFMRTTLTLEPEVAERVRNEMRRTGKAMKAVVNEALALGLGMGGKRPRTPRFEVRPHDFGFKPGVDLDRLNQLADELEAEEAARKLRP